MTLYIRHFSARLVSPLERTLERILVGRIHPLRGICDKRVAVVARQDDRPAGDLPNQSSTTCIELDNPKGKRYRLPIVRERQKAEVPRRWGRSNCYFGNKPRKLGMV